MVRRAVRQAVRQAIDPEKGRRTHHPEPSRRANSNDRNPNDPNENFSKQYKALFPSGEGFGRTIRAVVRERAICFEHWNIWNSHLFRI